MKMSTKVDLFTNVEPTSVSPAIAKPFVSRSTFYQGDCLVEMDKIEDKSVDMILCDLPYGTTACKWDSVIPFEPLWKQYERVIKDNGAIVLTASQPFTTVLSHSNIKIFRYELIWQKNNFTGFLNAGRMPLKAHENILIFYKKLPTYNPQKYEVSEKFIDKRKTINNTPYKESVFHEKKRLRKADDGLRNPTSILQFESETKTIHNTQKPVALMEYLVRTYTNEGETVLDNCMGSGTTGVACKNLNRNFIGIEKDEKYFLIAKNRIHEY
jgi:DNA modification methylase